MNGQRRVRRPLFPALTPLAALALAASSSCALLATLPAGGGVGGLTPPTIAFQGATLVQSPSQQRLAAYYCPEMVSVPFGGAGLLCQGFFGARPTPTEMEVAFDLRFLIDNPNNVPIPLASILAAVTVFPAASNQRLGATCVQLCGEGQTGCTGQAAAGACQASSRDIRSLDDFAAASANLLISAGISAAMGTPPTFVAPKVSAASRLEVVVRFAFGPEPLLSTLRQLASQSVNEFKRGQSVTFSIPYKVEGTIWFDAGSFGRLNVGYGPLDGTFVLPTDGLVPGLAPGLAPG
jgi:hypothetical protein